jgi:hypothetical protein
VKNITYWQRFKDSLWYLLEDQDSARVGFRIAWKVNHTGWKQQREPVMKSYWLFVVLFLLVKNLPILIASGAFLVALNK